METNIKRYIILKEKLPEDYPTHLHSNSFWENLGRTVATFGFLEEVLAKAIFSFTATQPYSDEEMEQAYEKWILKLKKAITDPLGNLITLYEAAVKDHPESTIGNLEDLINDLREGSRIRNALCHGSWQPPTEDGASIPRFYNRKMEKFDIAVDIKFLTGVRKKTINQVCSVVNSVTHMGWQFPGTNWPGEVIMNK